MRRCGLFALFFLSGVSALIYEIVWQRLLILVFGVSTLSVSAVLVAFMAGMALGGLIFGRVADRSSSPLRLYALLEGGIAVVGLLVPLCFAGLLHFYTWVHAGLLPGQWSAVGLRLALALVILLVPTTLMGGTVPLMGRLALKRSSGLPATFSLFYALNTLGAVAGAAATGFVLLRFLGMKQTLWLAAALNVTVAVSTTLASRWAHQDKKVKVSGVPCVADTAEFSPVVPSRWERLAWVCAAATGVTSMALEVGWARILGILTSNSAYGFAMMLTVILLGIALGSLLAARLSLFQRNSWRNLACCQWLLAGITLATLPYFRSAPDWLDRWCDGTSVAAMFLGEFLLCLSALFLPAVLMGLSLPLIVAGVVSDPNRFGKSLGRLYFVNTLGSALGAFLTGFVLIPSLGIKGTFGVIVLIALLVGLAAWATTIQPRLAVRMVSAGAVMGLAAAVWYWSPPGVYHKSQVQEPRHLLYYREGDNATAAVVEDNAIRTIMVDSQPVAGTGGTSVVDQKMLAHLPLLLHPNPQRALTVGFGSGGTSSSMLLHGIEVDCVEIERAVPAAAAFFRSENHGVLDEPHFRLIYDDARSWLQVAPVRYDAIVTDCTNIQYRSNGDLYTVDYFRLMKNRLTSTGVAAAWVPANGIALADLTTLLRSFREAFPHTSVWFMNSLATDFLIVVGTPDRLNMDMNRLRLRMEKPEIAADLDTVGLANAGRLAYTLMTSEEDLTNFLGTGPLNTDDRPVLSYSTYGANFRPTIAGNLLQLLACRSNVAQYVKNAPGADVMGSHLAASTEAILGHIAHLAGVDDVAMAHYVRASQLLSRDPDMQRLPEDSAPAIFKETVDVGGSTGRQAPPVMKRAQSSAN